MKKRLIASCAAASMLLSMFSAAPALADETDPAIVVDGSMEIVTGPEAEPEAELMDIVASGKCGTSLTWTLDDTGTLTISGTGKMSNWSGSFYFAPWYSEKDNISSVIIDSGVTTIGEEAFYDCSNLTSVSLPDGITSIGSQAFYGCSSLNSISLPDTLTSIQSRVFYNCNSLASITIPDSVTDIGSSAFEGCSGLKSVTLPDSLTSIQSRVFYGCSSLTDITIPDGVTGIEFYAFRYCSSLTNISLSNSLTSIGDLAFLGCVSLTDITIPDGVTSIGERAFYECSSLTSVNIPDSVTSIGARAFYYCGSLTSVTIPAGVTIIDDYTFCYCDSLESITISESVTTIKDTALYFCDSLTEIIVDPQNSYYSDIDGVLFNKSKTELVKYPAGKNETSYPIPDSVTDIGIAAFLSCINLTSMRIPDTVTSIGSAAFSGCSGLTEIIVDPQNSYYTSLDGVLFNKSGTELVKYPAAKSGAAYSIPDSVTTVVNSAFLNCVDLTSIGVPDTVTTIGSSAFNSCSSLTEIVVDPQNSYYSSLDGVLFDISKTTLLRYPSGKSNAAYSIPDGVTAIGSSAFNSCSYLTGINIPKGVTTIANSAFSNCSSLTRVSIPDTITTIGNAAFYPCDSISDVYYGGTEEEWKAIKMDAGNHALSEATIHYGESQIPDEDIVIRYTDGVVSFDGSMPIEPGTVLIQAIYTSEERLDRIEIHTIENISDTVTIDTDFVPGASKLMLWNSFTQMQPLADDITI